MRRRAFLTWCGTAAALAGAARRGARAGPRAPRAYARVRLIDASGGPLRAGALEPGVTYLFHYPFRSTPAFLLRLRAGALEPLEMRARRFGAYRWPGGVGPGRAVTAFCAICPHQLSYPKPRASFISYRPDAGEAAGRPRTVTCCAHHSVFDPARGGRVVRGPAEQPMTGIVLEHVAETDALYATGTVGPELYEAFFTAYAAELRERFGPGRADASVEGETEVVRLEDYTDLTITC